MAAKMSETEAGPSTDMPGYIQFAMDMYTGVSIYYKKADLQFDSTFFTGFFEALGQYGQVCWKDGQVVLMLAVLWTLARYCFTYFISAPLAKSLKLTTLNQQKFPESLWKVFFYSGTWGYSLYVLLLSGRHPYFYEPMQMWQDWHPGMVVPLDVYAVYAIQFSFYLHSVYGTLFMDHWRKDSIVMLFHHFLTMALIGFSFATRYYKVGLLVLFLMDITDICLEFTKCNVYLKKRGGKFYPIHDHLSTAGFLLFAVAWFVFRLYWYPLKVLHASAYGSQVFHHSHHEALPFFIFFNSMLWILLGLNVYWFMFIMSFLYKVATGQMSEVDDVREHEVVEKSHPGGAPVSNSTKSTKSTKSTPMENGNPAGDGYMKNGGAKSRPKKD